MKEVVIRIVPPYVDEDEFEDLLVTNSLFVEYFNAFLQLPTFPEPLIFNKETGGFEVHSNAKKELANEIKALIRADRRRKRIYRPVHHHSFSDIPLIPIEFVEKAQGKELSTSFTVKALNKEQGIQWVKRERLPLFLESDFYLEYRLAKLVSQAQIARCASDSVTVKLDYAPTIKKEKIQEEIQEEPADESEVILRDAYVCMGNAGTTDTAAWVSQAKITMDTSVTPSKPARPLSAMAAFHSHVHTGRPVSARSIPSSRKVDSGIWSSNKGSVYGDYQSMISDFIDDIPLGGDLFDPGPRPPSAPRPSDEVCVVATTRKGGRVYALPRIPTPTGDDTSSADLGIEADHISVSTEDGWKCIQTNEPSDKPVMFKNLDDLGNVIVATVLRSALSQVTGLSCTEINRRSDIQGLFKDQKLFSNLSAMDLTNMEFNFKEDGVKKATVESNAKPRDSDVRSILGPNSSDDDSVLNSDEDYEEDLDDFFRQTKKEHTLTNMKGLCAFKKFLLGSNGERNWLLWVDIERAKLINDGAELSEFLSAMRERYQKNGAPYELSNEVKKRYGLLEPSHWTMDRLKSIHNKIAEPLVLYWAPRFLVKEQMKVKPEQNPLYLQQLNLKSRQDSHPQPHPPVKSVLPLRPKSCMPRIRKCPQTPAQSLQISDPFEELKSSREEDNNLPIITKTTTPPVGLKRTYAIPDSFKLNGTKKSLQPTKKKSESSVKVVKTPRDYLQATLKVPRRRPSSAPVRLCSSTTSSVEPKPAQQAHWDLLSETSAPDIAPDVDGLVTAQPADSRRSSSQESGLSEFAGGRRMEALLQALSNEKKSGQVLRKYLEKASNRFWKNCLHFWEGVQEYHELHYSEIIDPYLLKIKAKSLHSRFVVDGARLSIRCNRDVREYVYHHIDPPYEELFDGAEEYVLDVLFDAWCAMLASDSVTFDKVELIETKRKLDSKRNKYLLALQRRGIIKEREDTPDEMEGYEDPVYDETLFEKIPEEFREWTLEKLVHHRLELEYFKQYLSENYASMDLMCWMDIEAFRRIPHSEEKRRDQKSVDIKNKYLTKKYFFGPNSPAGLEGQEKVIQAGGGWGKLLHDRPSTAALIEMQKYVRERLERNWLPRFLATEEFIDRQHPKVGMDDAVEDVMIQRKKKSQAIWRMMESKWVSASKDLMTFRKAIMNPVTSYQFRRFVSIKGENLENDVLFYQEVQRYKDLCHIHSERALAQQKTAAIINCFIDSPIPPSVQIDITPDVADNILERKLEATPYLFREAQLTVLRILFYHWSDFCSFRTNLTDEKLVPTLERHRKKARLEEKRKSKELEAKKIKDEVRRKSMGLPLNADLEDAFDPFSKGLGSDDEVVDRHEKSALQWSYAQYIDSFDKEKVLNDVDESTFSSLTARSVVAESIDNTNDTGGKSSLGNQKSSVRKFKGSELGIQVSSRKVRVKSPRGSPPPSPSQSKTSPKATQSNDQTLRLTLGGTANSTHNNNNSGGGGGPRITRKVNTT